MSQILFELANTMIFGSLGDAELFRCADNHKLRRPGCDLVGFKLKRWIDTVLMQRMLGQEDASAP